MQTWREREEGRSHTPKTGAQLLFACAALVWWAMTLAPLVVGLWSDVVPGTTPQASSIAGRPGWFLR